MTRFHVPHRCCGSVAPASLALRPVRRSAGTPGFALVSVLLFVLPQGSAVAASADPSNPAPAASPVPDSTLGQSPADGVMPAHLPSILPGRIDSLTGGGSGINLLAMGRVWPGGAIVRVSVPPYAHFYRIVKIDPGILRRGDSVIVQGRSADTPQTFNAMRIIRQSRKIPLGPGIVLAAGPALTAPTPVVPDSAAPAPPAAGGAVPAGANAAPAPNAPAAGGAAPAAPHGKKPLLRDQKALQRAINRGALPGQVVSTQPLAVELPDGEVWSVNLNEQAVVLDQETMASSDLADGSIVRITGSETAPGAYRAAEIDLVSPGLTLRDIVGGDPYGRAGRRVNPARRLFPRPLRAVPASGGAAAPPPQ